MSQAQARGLREEISCGHWLPAVDTVLLMWLLGRGDALRGTNPGLPKAQSSQESTYWMSCVSQAARCPAFEGLHGSNSS